MFHLTHLRVAVAIGALTLISGCASMTDCCYEHTQKSRAVVQYLKCGKPECSPHPHDYKVGWIDGFYEVATGGSDCPPAIAPSAYWKPGQILNDCDNRRHAYYSGWQDGAARASQFPDTHYLKIYETCECPFPRCENPCLNNACGPCGNSIGLPYNEQLIELPYHPVDDLSAGMVVDPVGVPASVPVAPVADPVPAAKKADAKPAKKAVKKAVDGVPAPVAAPALSDSAWNASPGSFRPVVREVGVATAPSTTAPSTTASTADTVKLNTATPVVLAPISFDMIDSESVVQLVK